MFHVFGWRIPLLPLMLAGNGDCSSGWHAIVCRGQTQSAGLDNELDLELTQALHDEKYGEMATP